MHFLDHEARIEQRGRAVLEQRQRDDARPELRLRAQGRVLGRRDEEPDGPQAACSGSVSPCGTHGWKSGGEVHLGR